ncbi:MAG: hypothetical protein ACFCU3_00050 [Verrucomicrobiales bacterium]
MPHSLPHASPPSKRSGKFFTYGSGVSFSIFIHLLIFSGAAAWSMLDRQPPKPPAMDPEPIQLTFIELPEPEPTPEPERQVIRTPDEGAEGKPEQALFESHRDTVATSEIPPREAESLMPQLSGEERPDYVELDQQEQRLGDEASSQQAPLVAETPTVEPVRWEPVQEVAEPPAEEVVEVPDLPVYDEARLFNMPETLTPLEPDAPRPEPVATPAPTPLPTPRPTPPPPPATQDSQLLRQRTASEGGVTEIGPGSVAAVGTPLGEYQRLVGDAIGSRWQRLIRSRIDLAQPGVLRLRFALSVDGRPSQIRVVSNTSTVTLESVSIQAILEAEIPAIPADVAAALDRGQLELLYTFRFSL